jgi:hypothetical protein
MSQPDPTNSDLLSQMLHAWREDIESVPFPQFSGLLIPRQSVRPGQAKSPSKTIG